MNPGYRATFFDDHYAGRDPSDLRTLFLICLLEFIEGLSDLQVVKKLYCLPAGRHGKQKHFEELIAAAGLVYDVVRLSASLINNPEVKKEMEILGRILEERINSSRRYLCF